jgi:hypothetical protein
MPRLARVDARLPAPVRLSINSTKRRKIGFFNSYRPNDRHNEWQAGLRIGVSMNVLVPGGWLGPQAGAVVETKRPYWEKEERELSDQGYGVWRYCI